jgi:hypothetical protein
MVCGAHLFVLSTDAQRGLELAAGVRNGAKFLSAMWQGRLSIGEEFRMSKVDSGWLFISAS